MFRTRCAWLVTILVIVVLAACSSDGDSGPDPTVPTTSTTTTTTSTTTASTATGPAPTTAASAVRILSLTGPPSPVDCNAPTQIQLHWRTSGASKVELRIDGGPIFATYPDGPREPLVPLSCDGETHTYELTARAANGQSVQRSLKLEERRIGVS